MENDLLHSVDEWGPEKVICVADRRTGMRGVLVIDNTARGMGKGGTRMSPTLTVNEVARLARTMTWKWAAVDLFFGGAKAGILGDPESPRKPEVLRAFARALRNEVPEEYVFGLDMGMAEADAAVLFDELGSREVAVGLPEVLGGLAYDKLGVTGFGVAEAADEAAATVGLTMGRTTVAVQGFGAVGEAAARRLADLGATVVAVSTSVGAVIDADGIDLELLTRLRRQAGDRCVLEYGGCRPTHEALEADADILVPAARQDVVDEGLARDLKARLVVEAANMPTTPAALEVLHGRGVPVVPDFIANAGGVIAAAYSMDARTSAFPVEPDEVFAAVSRKMRANASRVLIDSQDQGVAPHAVARRSAQERVRAAMALRGMRPPGRTEVVQVS